jgi:protoporphyrinogen IX oxidase
MNLYLKATHIIFVVTWFAGLFYIVRLFIYQVEADAKPEPDRSILGDQLKLMARRLWYGITWPSAILTAIMGGWMLIEFPGWVEIPFMQIKLGFVGLLYVYHFSCHYIFSQLQQGKVRFTSTQLRLWNEVATVFLVVIVFLIVVKNSLSLVWALGGLVALTGILLLAINMYKRIRTK